jgi:segregation and condensation protein B
MSTQTAEILIDDIEPMDPIATNGASRDAEPDVGEDVARLVPIIEGMLFAAGTPVPVARLVEALDGPDRRTVAAALDRLADRLEHEGRGLRLARVAGGYQLRTLAEHGPWIRRLLGGRPPRLSRAMLETVAIIAYRQPCTRPEIEAIRGVEVDTVLSTLLERRLVRMVGRKEAPGRPILYGTTKEFLEVFGLPDVEALPPLRDLGEMADVLRAQEGDAGATDAPPVEDGAPDAAGESAG